MDPNEVRTDPDDQRARGLDPDEQREEREQESRESDETKFQQLVEGEADERRSVADRLANDPLVQSDDES